MAHSRSAITDLLSEAMYNAPNTSTYDFAMANMSRQAREGAVLASTGLPPKSSEALESEGVKLSDALRRQDGE